MIRCRPDVDAMLAFTGDVAAADAPWLPLSEHKLRGLSGTVPADSAAWCAGDAIVAVAVAAEHVAAGGDRHVAVEAALAPEERSAAADLTLIAAVGDWLGEVEHTFWAWRRGQIEAMEAEGYREVRAVVRMERPLPTFADEAPPLVTIDRFVSGQDDAALVGLNNAAFAGHPENDNFTVAELGARMSLAWFDPAGIITARLDGELVGFCWTKVSGEEDVGQRRRRVGEIYIVAVAPRAQGRGIGRAVVLEALRDLSERRGVEVGMLWVESTNTQARSLYRQLGFTDVLTNREFVRDGSQPNR